MVFSIGAAPRRYNEDFRQLRGNVILKILQKHTEERSLLNARQFGFRAWHSTTLQCMRLTDHVTLNFNNTMSTAAVFWDIEKAY
jgi:hypothetical protein